MPTSVTVTPIPAFSDNYIWLLETGQGGCTVVDPGDAGPVAAALDARGLRLDNILVTHHHPDHIGGIEGLLQRWTARVFGPDDPRIALRTDTARHGEKIRLGGSGVEFEVIAVPGHTRSHVAYYGQDLLFCGDTLFSAGCGRLFEGTAEDMQASLDCLSRLPPQTRVYCAHEYTRANCMFALAVEPDNTALQAFERRVRERRGRGLPTVPSTLATELEVNPFLRTRHEPVVRAARRFDPQATPGERTLATIRAWKDRFQ